MSEKATERAVHLAKRGMSHADIAKTLAKEKLAKVSRRSVSRALESAGVASGRGRPRNAKKAPIARTKPAKSATSSPPTAVDIETLFDALDGAAPHELVARRLVQCRDFADSLHAEELVGGYAQLVRLEADLAAKLESMRPPPPVDPATDPANVEARRRVRAELKRLGKVRRAELAKKLCSTCRVATGIALEATP